MPKQLIIIVAILLLGSWFVLGEKKSFGEKLAIVFGIIAIYVAYRLMGGATFQEILAPLTH